MHIERNSKAEHFRCLMSGWLCVASSMLVSPRMAVAQATFDLVGDLPGGIEGSLVSGLSGDGQVAVGYSIDGGCDNVINFHPIRWTPGDGLVGLGVLPGTCFGRATSADWNGAWIVGQTYPAAFVWEEKVGLAELPALMDDPEAWAAAVASFTSTIVVGWSGESGVAQQPVRWIAGTCTGLGLPSGYSSARAAAVSADAMVTAVGTTISVVDLLVGYPHSVFRHTDADGYENIGLLPGFESANIMVQDGKPISGDGSTIVGYCWNDDDPDTRMAFRHRTASSFLTLGDLPGGAFSATPGATNFNGTVIVGRSVTDLGTRAFIWDELHDMRNLQTVCETDYGVDFEGWTLVQAYGLSFDGRVIGGSATRDGVLQGYVVTLPPAAPADLDGDGDIDIDDFGIIAHFLAGPESAPTPGSSLADIDSDEDVDLIDFAMLQAVFGD